MLGSRPGLLTSGVRTLCPANWRLGGFQRQGGSFEEEKMFCHCRVVYSIENTSAEFCEVKVKFALFVKVTYEDVEEICW